MIKPSNKDFTGSRESESTAREKGKEKFLIHRCPTPGCRCGTVRPLMRKGKITGFSCSNGCRYTAKRNQLTGEIDYYELMTYNHYRVDSGAGGFRASHTGAPCIEWH